MRHRRLAAALLVLAGACGPAPGIPDAGSAEDGGDGSATDGGVDAATTAVADAGASRYAEVDEEVVLDGAASTGALRFQWTPGGGLPVGPESGDPILRVRYPQPGRHQAVLTVWGADGRRRTDAVVITVTRPRTYDGARSSSIAIAGDRLAVVSPDSDELVLARRQPDGSLADAVRVPVCDEPRTVAVGTTRLAVACTGDAIAEIDPTTLAVSIRAMPRGSRPFGIVPWADGFAVTLQGTGEVARIEGGTITLVPAIEDARAIAVMPDGRVGVTRWRSPDARGEVALLDLGSGAREVVSLAYDPQASSDTEVGGVPSYLEQLVISPDATLAVIPSLQAAIGEGLHRTGGERALTFQTTMRAVVSYLDLGASSASEGSERRRQLDNRGFANAAVFSSRGDYLFVATRGARSVERIDVLRDQLSGSIGDVGLAPNGLALSPDDRFLYVDAYLSREVVAYDVSSFDAAPAPIARLPIVATEPLSPEVLRGKQLFNDALDPRLGSDGYVACAHCHLDGLDDHRTWDFTDRGEGLRNTTSLLGAPTTGAIHWSANFDELQDFEHDLRGPFRGTGLMSDADFHTGTRDTTLGDPKAGVSADLDALAAYVASLAQPAPSPHRSPDGSLPEAAARGRVLFGSSATGCTTCHAGAALHDSGFTAPGVPRLHDVGTLGPGSGLRLGAALPGIDTPTLHGVWSTAPYLHDGSAATLRDVLITRNASDAHGVTSHLSDAEVDDLVAYLLCLDGRAD